MNGIVGANRHFDVITGLIERDPIIMARLGGVGRTGMSVVRGVSYVASTPSRLLRTGLGAALVVPDLFLGARTRKEKPDGDRAAACKEALARVEALRRQRAREE